MIDFSKVATVPMYHGMLANIALILFVVGFVLYVLMYINSFYSLSKIFAVFSLVSLMGALILVLLSPPLLTVKDTKKTVDASKVEQIIRDDYGMNVADNVITNETVNNKAYVPLEKDGYTKPCNIEIIENSENTDEAHVLVWCSDSLNQNLVERKNK